MNNNKPIAIVLGGTGPSITILENLKNRGYYTILVDYLENPPAKSFADEHSRISTLDKEEVIALARRTKAAAIINLLVDQPLVTASYVSEQLNLPSLISYENAKLLTNKALMKQRMIEHQIPTAKYCIITEQNQINSLNLDFPLVAKPIIGTGSLGVKKINSFDELKCYIADMTRNKENTDIILEEYYRGVEIQVDCFIKNNISYVIMTRDKEKILFENKYDFVVLGSIIPANISPKAKEKIYTISQTIAKAFKLNNTPMHFQAFVDGDTVNIIEIAARIGGATGPKIIKLAAGLDIVDYSLDTLLGKEKELHYCTPTNIYSTAIIYAKQCTFGEVIGLDELVHYNIIEDFYIFKTKGMIIPSGLSAKNKVGIFFISAKSTEEMAKKIDYIFEKTDIHDINGNSVMLKDLKKTVIHM